MDYPLYGEKVGNAVVSGEAELGIAICGTGVGISIACNKVNGVRAVCCSEPYSAKLSRIHNNSNVLCFGARVIGSELAKMIVDEWLGACLLYTSTEDQFNLYLDETEQQEAVIWYLSGKAIADNAAEVSYVDAAEAEADADTDVNAEDAGEINILDADDADAAEE